ncbi:hypothetical protein HNR56_002028 [Roseospira marina]|nr:hypothetical protein [Roseospira marina]MBB5087332.1 hypothetical protein [Roseospira marina]
MVLWALVLATLWVAALPWWFLSAWDSAAAMGCRPTAGRRACSSGGRHHSHFSYSVIVPLFRLYFFSSIPETVMV